jgi:hypothetical protein
MSRSRLDHHHHLAGRLEGGDQVGQRVAADDVGQFAAAGGEGVGDARGPVVDGDRVAATGDVEGEVLAHHGQADQSDVARRLLGHARMAPGIGSARSTAGERWVIVAGVADYIGTTGGKPKGLIRGRGRNGLKPGARLRRCLGVARRTAIRGTTGSVAVMRKP